MTASTVPPSTTLYNTQAVPAGVIVAFNDELLDADEQASLIDWLTEQHHLRYVQYVIDCDGHEAVLLTNTLEGIKHD